MVFESLVADLLNKYLGQYVENLDASQLKIGIWGGNVVLENLQLKDTALDDLALPIKVVHGFLGKLTLSIPWKNLYHESTIVVIEDLHLLAKPNFDIKYDAKREENAKIERKKKQIENIEEARRLEERKQKGKDQKEEESDGFAEKLATNVIKNLQVTIKNIHIRYEDSISDVSSPFSIGISLENLSAQTTDKHFVPTVIKESVTIIHKLVELNNLALYWNPKESLKNTDTEEWLTVSKKQIARSTSQPSNMRYILQPIVATKKVKINTKPGIDLSIPKIFLDLVMEELGIVLMRTQYHGLVHLLESFERMNKNVPFRKYRPSVNLHSNATLWWRYCINSVLIEDVKRRSQMWCWTNIKQHRDLCREYKEKYKLKIASKDPKKTLITELEALENKLNVVSITIFRSLAENEVIREKKAKKESSFFGMFSKKKVEEQKKKTSSKIEEMMGSEKDAEMKKLYQAIGYTDNEVTTPFPKEYVATIFQFELKSMSVTIKDEDSDQIVDVIRFTLDNISMVLKQRPSANGLKVHAKIKMLKLFGTPNNEEIPLMVRSITSDATSNEDAPPLVDLLFEINPLLKENIDQSIQCVCQPLEIIYDAMSVNKAIAFFAPPEDVVLRDLQQRAYSTFEDFKESSTAGLLYAMEQRSIMDVNILLHASYLIVPEKGSMVGCTDMVVIDFGSFQLQSDPSQISFIDPKAIENIDDVKDQAYDRFSIALSNLQMLLCKEGEDFHKFRKDFHSQNHVLYPLEFHGKLSKSILPSDPRLKQIVVSGVLNSLDLSVSDDKIARIVKLVDSLPLPKVASDVSEVTDSDGEKFAKKPSLSNLARINEDAESSIHVPNLFSASLSESDEEYGTPPDSSSILRMQPGQDPSFESGIANQVIVEIKFEITKVKLSIALTDKELKHERQCLEISIDNIGTEVNLRRWDMFVNANIGRLLVREMQWGIHGDPLDILSTPKDSDMFQVSFRKCQFNETLNLGPSYMFSTEAQQRALHYKEEFHGIEQIIDVKMSMLYVVLHQEALLAIMSLVEQVLKPLNADQQKAEVIKNRLSKASSKVSLAIQKKDEHKESRHNKDLKNAAVELKSKVGIEKELKMKVTASMAGIGVFVCSSTVDLAQAFVKGLSAQVILEDTNMEVKASMKDLQLQDNVGESKFSKIISMQSDQVFDLEVAIFDGGSAGVNLTNAGAVDTRVKLNVGQMKLVFLNRFVMDILSFVNHFEDAQQAIKEAGKTAREKATAAVTEYNKHSSRHQLNIILRAPMIVIPVHSNAELGLLVDLGELRVYNNFKVLNQEKQKKDIVITDNMMVKLTDLKLLKALIKDGNEVISRKEMIKPVTLNISVVRNLTPLNHSIPDVAVHGKLETIRFVLSEEDVNVAMKILQGNIAEGEARASKKKKKINKGDNGVLELGDVEGDRLASIYEEPNAGAYQNLSLKFDLEKIVMQIYVKPSDMTFEEEFLERDLDWLLSEFTVDHLAVKGSMMSDNSMEFTVQLKTLILDDMRPNSRETLTRMIDNCPEPLIKVVDATQQKGVEDKKEELHMIDVIFKQSSTLDKNIDICLSNLLCILNVEFIMVLVRTLLAAIPKDDKARADSLSTLGSPAHSIASSSDEDADLTAIESGVAVDADVKHPELRLMAKVQNPQVVLLADAKDIKTNALFLTMGVDFQYMEINNIQKIMGTVVNTAVLSTAFKVAHRTDISTVLSLPTINLYSSAPLGGKPHVHVSTSMIKLNISPKTIRTISACVGQTAAPPDEEVIREAKKAMEQLWEFRDLSTQTLWYLSTPPPEVLSAGSFVLARTEEGDYQNGFLAKKDTHFTIYFYPKGTISHAVNDVTSVVVDVAPTEKDLVVGVNVVALTTNAGWRSGRVMELWIDAGKTPQDQSGKVTTEENWELMHKESHDKFNKFLVQFYHSKEERYFVSEELRIIPRPLKGIVPGLGGCVYARYRDGFYYRGIIVSMKGYKVRVNLEEISDYIEHDVDDPSAVILNMTPRESQVKRYFKVVAAKDATSKGYHPGKVVTVQGNAGYRSYTIQFEDGTTYQVPVTKLLLMPKAPHDALPEIGTYVYSRVAKDAPLYEKGIVADKDEKIFVKHLNGRKLAHDRKNIGFVIRNIVPTTAHLYVGVEVIAQVDGDDHKMYLGVVKEIVPGKKITRYLVQFTDGSSKRLTPGKIRIFTTYGGTEIASGDSEANVSRREELMLVVDGVSLRVEGYLGGKLEPMLRFDSKIVAELYDWSSKLNAKANLSLNASYYNDVCAEWEPLIEPIIQDNNERPWELSIEYVTEDDNIQSADSHSEEVSLLQKPITSLQMKSNDNLEVTLTKSTLSLLQDLGKVFGEAVESTDMVIEKYVVEKDPYVIYNKLGKQVTVAMNALLQTKNNESSVTIETSSCVNLCVPKSGRNKTISHPRHNLPIISIKVDGYEEIKDIAVKRQKTVIYDLIPVNILTSSAAYSLIVEVSASDGQRVITIRSPLQIKNHFPMPLDISYMTNENRPVKLSSIDSGFTYAVPLLPAYHSNLFVKPAGFGYNDSTEALNWSDLSNGERRKLFVCSNPVEGVEPFYLQVVVTNDVYTSVHGMLGAAPRYTLHCYPPIILHNYLPCPVEYKVQGMEATILEGGSHWPLFTINHRDQPIIDLKIENYMGHKWIGNLKLTPWKNGKDSKTVTLVLQAEERRLEIGAFFLQEGALNVTLYSPYWLLNKTGKSLVYQAVGSNITHEHNKNQDGALMLHVTGKKKKARVCVSGCEWSAEFPLDTIGSGGQVKSKGLRERIFEIGVGISLSYFGLTKIVTFTPLRILSNHTEFSISMAEADSETAEWHKVDPGESVPYWPTCLPPKNLCLNIDGKDSVKFNLEAGKTLLLKLRQIGGLCVNYQEKDSTSLLSFSPYFAGSAPVRIENLCKKVSMISYKQADYFKGHVLTYGQSILYTWDDPTLKHKLVCSVIEVNDSITEIKLDSNDFGRMKAGDTAIYWVSFLDGLQRVLLFTDNFKSAYCASQEQTLRPTQEIDVNIKGLGLSLVNTEKRLDIAYLAIQKSPIVWEQFRKNRWKTLAGGLCEALEEGFQKGSTRKTTTGWREKIQDMEVDYDKMFITKPEKIRIRRTFHSGIGFQYIVSPNRMQISATISSLQFDSHVPGSTFLTIIHQVEPPKSITNDNAPKPFFEMSMTTNIGENNVVHEISYLKVLVQEMDIRIDKGFIMEIMDLVHNEKTRGNEKEQYRHDMAIVKQKLENSPEFQATKQDKRYVFNDFHLSPLKLHVSFSMTGGYAVEGGNTSSMQGNILGLLLQSVGVAFTEIQDVEFKLACFEVKSVLLSQSQLMDGIAKHYQTQAIKQLYVLVLGLDVLGNPYGLITGVGTGAKNLFYEPYQGLIQGPEEFAEGLAYGVKGLIGGTVGGVSGAVSKITGTVGKGLAALTLDDEYQQKRRQAMSQRPQNLGQGLAKGGKGLVKGIFSGVTGIITKPVEGARQDGASGFFKGVGKGLIGVVARPAGGVVDMASSTFEGLKSTTSGIQTVKQLRVARVFHADKVLRPFNNYEADGNKVLMEANKGSFAKSDAYFVHVHPVDGKNYLVLTNKKIIYITKNNIINEWESAWVLSFNDLKGTPEMTGNTIAFNTHITENRRQPFFKRSASCRTVTMPTEATATWFMTKLDAAKLL